MWGNLQVRFLGDKGGVIRLSYPTKPTAQMAHLVFSDTPANAQKTKRAIFFQSSTEIQEKVNFIPYKLIYLRKTKTS